jgi:hypothetical protein
MPLTHKAHTIKKVYNLLEQDIETTNRWIGNKLDDIYFPTGNFTVKDEFRAA